MFRRNPTALAAVVILAAAILPLGAISAGAATPAAAATVTPKPVTPKPVTTPTPLSHVFIIMEENHALDHTIGDINPATKKLSMPYLTALAKNFGQATQYYGVTHTSEPNYIAATSGSTWGVNNDNEWEKGSTVTASYTDSSTTPPTTVKKTYTLPPNRYNHTNIVDELDAAHIPWAAYMQAMPSAGYLGDTANGGLYLSKHNPFILYNDIHNNKAVAKNIKPYTAMAKDLNSGNAPRYVWITPDICTDMHLGVSTKVPGFTKETPCPYSNAMGDAVDEHSKSVADSFIRDAVTTIMHSKAWTAGSVIFITADESDYDPSNPAIGDYYSAAGCCDSPVLPPADPEVGTTFAGGVYGGGLVPMVVVTKSGPRRVTDASASDHYSMLLTIEQGLGLGKLGYTTDSANVKGMWALIDRR